MIQLLLALIYVAGISLGLPDAMLGAAWPTIYPQLGVPMSYAGAVTLVIAAGTVVSSLLSDRMTLKLGTGKVTALSVGTTAIALLGFSMTDTYWGLLLWAIPYGLGAGGVDAGLNNYIAVHYESRHMSWFHCMWGVGAASGPYIMGWALTGGLGWHTGYRTVGIIQIVLTAILFLSLPLWKGRQAMAENGKPNKALSLPQIFAIPGAKPTLVCFFCYVAIEQTMGFWASSYLNLYRSVPAETAATFGTIFYLGLTAGRFLSGFVTMKLTDDQMVWLGQALIAAGLAALLIPGPQWLALGSIVLIGLGCAPLYPAMLHATPDRFGPEKSQAIMGVQMAAAYIGICAMPPLFGVLADLTTIALLPIYLFGLLAVLFVLYKGLAKRNLR